jgi:C4-dicarboxylate transporter DctM subunit
MTGIGFEIGIIAALIMLIFLGVHIVVALGIASIAGIALATGSLDIALTTLATTAYQALRDYVFAVLPLFILMGELIGKSGAARDLYVLMNRLLRRLPGRLALATVMGNAIFAFVTGVSIAAAAAFSRIAYPEMVRHGYDKSFALGSVAGSACLGMLIPPSILMIVWGVLTESSIGHLFIAGIVPGFVLSGLFCVYILFAAILRPELVGEGRRLPAPAGAAAVPRGSSAPQTGHPQLSAREVRISVVGLTVVIFAVLGGIWLGAFTPTEAAGIGTLLALVLALLKGVRLKGLLEAMLITGRTSAPILILIIMAQLYSRLLAISGLSGTIQQTVLASGLGAAAVLGIMVLVWFVLGMFIDSISIMLITVPIFTPLAGRIGYDPISFALIGILAIEAGLLTPPFGLVVYTVKSSVNDPEVSLGKIFAGSTPYWIMLLILTGLVALFPPLANWLPRHMM